MYNNEGLALGFDPRLFTSYLRAYSLSLVRETRKANNVMKLMSYQENPLIASLRALWPAGPRTARFLPRSAYADGSQRAERPKSLENRNSRDARAGSRGPHPG